MQRYTIFTSDKNRPSAQLTHSDFGGFREQRNGRIQPVDEQYVSIHYGHRAIAFVKENAGFWVGIRFIYRPATSRPESRQERPVVRTLPRLDEGWERRPARHTRLAMAQ